MKNFLIVFFAFAILYTLVDVMFNVSNLPSSSNLFVLYVVYIFLYSMFLLYPLSVIFAFLFTLNNLIKFNELVSFFSLGFSQKKILKPFFISGGVIIILMLLLQAGKLAYAREYAVAIKNANKLTTKNLFLRYQNKIIYMQKLNPILKMAKGVKVFYLHNSKVIKIVDENSYHCSTLRTTN